MGAEPLLARDKEAMGIIATLAFSFAGMFAFISGSPFVYISYFHVPAQYYGLLFGMGRRQAWRFPGCRMILRLP